MKKFVAIIVLFIVLTASACAEIYPQTFVVSDIESTSNTVVLVDFNGNAWEWEGVEDYDVGDIVAAIMDDDGTPNIYDDTIVNIQYAGYMEGWE